MLRLHMSAPPDSFSLSQLQPDGFDLTLFGEGLASVPYEQLPSHPILLSLQQRTHPDSLTLNVRFTPGYAYLASAYPDVNRRDLLVGLVEVEIHNEAQVEVEVPRGDGTATSETESKIEVSRGFGTAAPEVESKVEDAGLVEEPVYFRTFPGEVMEWYLRWISESPESRSSANHLRLSGSAPLDLSPIQSEPHPWADRLYSRPYNVQLPSRVADSELELTLFSPEWRFTHNSDYPYGANDGPLWQGRGWNHSISMGAGVRNNFFEAVFRPVFVQSSNRDFDLSPHPAYPGLSGFALPLTYADLPQRFGTEPYSRFDMGDSFIRTFYRGFTAGLSNERIRTGPAYTNPLLFGAHPPGFFHSFIGTDGPVTLPGLSLSARLFWGSLQESGFFVANSEERVLPESRAISGMTLNLAPDLIPGLHLGVTRTALMYRPPGGLSPGDYVLFLRRSEERSVHSGPYDSYMTKTAFFLRWHFPEAGFEVYTEWGRYDNRRFLRDLLSEPELNRGFVLGFMKRLSAGSTGRFLLQGEITNVENSSVTSQYRDFNIWYTHPQIQQGFTHRGQVLGTSIGPGSSTQTLRFTWVDRFGLAGVTLGRIAMHNDRLFKNYEEYYFFTLPRQWMTQRWIQETEMYGILHGLLFLPYGLELQLDLRYGLIENRHNQFIRTMEVDFTDIFFDEPNWNLSFILRYHLR